jgi:hypothetical protein
MTDFLKYFAFAFVVAFAFGAINGCKQRNSTTDLSQLQQTVIDHLHYTFEPDENGKRQLRLSFVCKGIEFYGHSPSPKDDHGEYTQRIEPRHSSESESTAGEDVETIFVTATGLHANEIMVWLSRGTIEKDALLWNKGKVIAVLLGSASGFYAGRWATSRGQPECDSQKVLSGLKDNTLWLASIRTLLKQLLDRVVVLQKGEKEGIPLSRHLLSVQKVVENDQFGMCSWMTENLIELNTKVNDVNYRLSSQIEFIVAREGPRDVISCLAQKGRLAQVFPQYSNWNVGFLLRDELPPSQTDGAWKAAMRKVATLIHFVTVAVVTVPFLLAFALVGFFLVRVFG